MSLILDHVSYTYEAETSMEIKALNDINLVIPDGQFIGLTVGEDIAFAPDRNVFRLKIVLYINAKHAARQVPHMSVAGRHLVVCA